jgi:alpha-1,2-mannosyltransferase
VQRLAGQGTTTLLIVGVLCVLCVAISGMLVHRLHARGERLGALLVTAFCGLLVCPVSWTHHWVWVVPLVAFLVPRALRGLAWAKIALATIVVVGSGWGVLRGAQRRARRAALVAAGGGPGQRLRHRRAHTGDVRAGPRVR